MRVYTIGYEGRSLPHVTQEMMNHSVDVVVDVRELPLSRKAGFSKNGLAAALREHGIGYKHMKSLGTPRPMRQQLRQDNDYGRFFASYRQWLEANGDAVAELAALAREKTICLLCFEKDPRYCHRFVLASLLQTHGFDVVHL